MNSADIHIVGIHTHTHTHTQVDMGSHGVQISWQTTPQVVSMHTDFPGNKNIFVWPTKIVFRARHRGVGVVVC